MRTRTVILPLDQENQQHGDFPKFITEFGKLSTKFRIGIGVFLNTL